MTKNIKEGILYYVCWSVIVFVAESFGPGRFNAARGRGSDTRQSSTTAGGPPAYYSFLAVDGDKRTDRYNYCTNTGGNRINWWRVNLGKLYLIYSVSITSTAISNPKLGKFRINYYKSVGLDLNNNGLTGADLKCAEQTGEQDAGKNVRYQCTSSPPIAARWIVVRQEDTKNRELRLCEVEVEADKVCTPFGSVSGGTVEYQLPERAESIPSFHDENKRDLLTSPPHGTKATFKCDNGYRIDGDLTSTCGMDGTWTSSPASLRCEACQDGHYGEDCSSVCGSCRNGTICNHITGNCNECEPGFIPPLCRKFVDCGPLSSISNGNVEVESSLYGSNATYVCKEGFKIRGGGNNVRRCDADGTWSGQEPVCVDKFPCVSGSCLNSGSCSDSSNGFPCICYPGFEGKTCENNLKCESRPCLNGGTCSITTSHFECRCQEGFTGDICQTMVDEEVIDDDANEAASYSAEESFGDTNKATTSLSIWYWILIMIWVCVFLGLVVLGVVVVHRRRQNNVILETRRVSFVSEITEKTSKSGLSASTAETLGSAATGASVRSAARGASGRSDATNASVASAASNATGRSSATSASVASASSFVSSYSGSSNASEGLIDSGETGEGSML